MTIEADTFLTLAEAADVVKVHKSTIQRLIARGELPAYRLSQRGVRVRRSELERALAPVSANAEKGAEGAPPEDTQSIQPLSTKEQHDAIAAFAEARRLRTAILERLGGKPFAGSDQLINQSRDERSRELAE